MPTDLTNKVKSAIPLGDSICNLDSGSGFVVSYTNTTSLY